MTIKIGVITIFPEMFNALRDYGITRRALELKLWELQLANLRDFSDNKHQKVDDYPFGGGGGMILSYQPIAQAIKCLSSRIENPYVIYPTPAGQVLNQADLKTILSGKNLIFICGRYEGIDQRVIDKYVDYEISIGNYVLSGGEIPVMAMIDATVRLMPGALGNHNVFAYESLENSLLNFPQYTRPYLIEDMSVPDILLSGNHKEILKWRLQQRIIRTYNKRQDLISKKDTNHEDK